LGESAGEAAHTLNVNEIPAHTHPLAGSASTGSQPSPAGNFWAVDDAAAVVYNVPASATASMSSAAISTVGGSQPHSNMAPYLVLNFCIALNGIFPTRN
jgi:microcystin-dependent protein